MDSIDFCRRLFAETKGYGDTIAVVIKTVADPYYRTESTAEFASRHASVWDTSVAGDAIRVLESLGLLEVRLGGLLTWLDDKPPQIDAGDECWADALPEEFEKLWKAYKVGNPRMGKIVPSKGPKAPARKLYLQIVKTPDMIGDILQAAQSMSADNWPSYNGYSPHIVTWLRQRVWQDHAEDVPPDAPKAGPKESQRKQLLALVKQGNLTRQEAERRYGGPLGE